MKNIVDHAEFFVENYNQSDFTEKKDNTQELTAIVINELFEKLASSICPAMKYQYPGPALDAVKREWSIGLQDAGISDSRDLERGISKCRLRKDAYAPFLPPIGHFIAWCKQTPEDLGLPNAQEAYKIAHMMNRKDDPYIPLSNKIFLVVTDALLSIGRERFRSLSITDAPKAFYEAYPKSVELYANGTLKSAPKVLNNNLSETLERNKRDAVIKPEYKNVNASDALAEMRRKLGIKK